MSHEMLSAALDGECSPAELERLLDELESNPQLKLAWSRMSLARDVVSGSRASPEQRCICAGVMAGLEQEGTKPSPKVIELARRRPAYAWRPVAGLAAAATVAGFALVAAYKLQVPAVTAGSPAAITASASTTATSALPEAARTLAVSTEAPDQQRSWESLSSGDAQQLDGYLIDYANYRSGAGMGDTLGYARFAAHTAEYHPDGR